MSLSVNLSWQGGLAFKGETESGHSLLMDGALEAGGENRGPKPIELALLALGGCTAMDVVSILRKMREPLASLSISLSAGRSSDHPRVFKTVAILFQFGAEGDQTLDPEKVEKAIRLSAEKYCSVGNMINKTAAITYEFEINGQRRRVGTFGGVAAG